MYTESFEQLEGIHIYRYSMLHDADKATLGFFIEFICCWLATLWLATKAYIRKPFQAIHACNPPDTYFALALLFRPLGVKFVFDHHDLCPEMFLAKGRARKGLLYRGLLLLERLTLHSADAIIAVNESHRDIAIRRDRIAAGKVTIVRSGPPRFWSEIEAANPECKMGRPYLVVYLGEMGSQDGLDYLLRTIRHYADTYPKEVLFTLIGGGPEQQRMKTMAHRMGLATNWTNFTGRVTEEKLLWQFLATADLCIAPDPFTAYGDLSTTNKMIEYLAFGKPVVAFDLTEHRRSALDSAEYVEPNDYAKLSTATHDLLLDEDRRREMGRRGRQRFRTHLAWENSEKELIALYSTLLGVEESEKVADVADSYPSPGLTL